MREVAATNVPACPPPRVHVLVYQVVDIVRFLIIRLVSGARKKTILVIGVLKLVRVDLCLLSAPRLSLSNAR